MTANEPQTRRAPNQPAPRADLVVGHNVEEVAVDTAHAVMLVRRPTA